MTLSRQAAGVGPDAGGRRRHRYLAGPGRGTVTRVWLAGPVSWRLRVLVRGLLMGFWWRDAGEARRINVRFRRFVRF